MGAHRWVAKSIVPVELVRETCSCGCGGHRMQIRRQGSDRAALVPLPAVAGNPALVASILEIGPEILRALGRALRAR